MDLRTIADHINTLAEFCGPRDLSDLSPTALKDQFGLPQADVLVLFGGTIVAGVEILKEAIQRGIAKKFLIVGGHGHTTETLKQQLLTLCPSIDPKLSSEAELLAAYLCATSGEKVDLLETHSTNCGNNITYLLALLAEHHIDYNTIILCQDATMQKRMAATLEKFAQPDLTIINYATYKVKVTVQNQQLVFVDPPKGMWTVMRYLTLLMGEIPRLTNDVNGYGPKGANFLAPVDIPDEVRKAFTALQKNFPQHVREADPRFK